MELLTTIIPGIVSVVVVGMLVILLRSITRTYEKLMNGHGNKQADPAEFERILDGVLLDAVNEAVKKSEDRARKRKQSPVREQLEDYSDEEIAAALEAAATGGKQEVQDNDS